MAQIYEISDETYRQIVNGEKNIYAEKQSKYKTLSGWENGGRKNSICIVRDDYVVREELRIPVSRIEAAYLRVTSGDGTELP